MRGDESRSARIGSFCCSSPGSERRRADSWAFGRVGIPICPLPLPASALPVLARWAGHPVGVLTLLPPLHRVPRLLVDGVERRSMVGRGQREEGGTHPTIIPHELGVPNEKPPVWPHRLKKIKNPRLWDRLRTNPCTKELSTLNVPKKILL